MNLMPLEPDWCRFQGSLTATFLCITMGKDDSVGKTSLCKGCAFWAWMMPSPLETGFESLYETVLMWPTEALMELCVVGDAGAAAGALMSLPGALVSLTGAFGRCRGPWCRCRGPWCRSRGPLCRCRGPW